jgi:hypothetical protein
MNFSMILNVLLSYVEKHPDQIVRLVENEVEIFIARRKAAAAAQAAK